ETHEAVGFVRPGGRARDVLNKRNIEAEKLKKNDVLIVLCGTNDVARNEAEEVFVNLTSTLQKTTETNVIVVDLPKRYDLADWSCVNGEVYETNRRIKDFCQNYRNVMCVEASEAGRHLHTQQGLHLNTKGKRWIAELLAKKIVELTTKKTTTEEALNLSISGDQPPPPGTEPTSGNDLNTLEATDP
ncbi:hypothetical protein J6590_028834, partial [Homalodisca vitripennis]